MTTILINPTHPALSIYNPETGGYARFVAGKLEIEDDDPNYAWVMAEGQRNPSISIVKSAVFCPYCGEPFAGKPAKALEAAHVKNVHFDKWVERKEAEQAEETNVLVKERAGIACDVCQPVQVFADQDALMAHTKLVHTAPDESAAPVDVAAEVATRRPGEVDPVT